MPRAPELPARARLLGRVLLLLALLPALGLAQGAPAPAPPPGPPSGEIPWWLWPSMLVPPLFLIVAGVLGTRWFDRHRGAQGRQPE